jgi:hypothetical protein
MEEKEYFAGTLCNIPVVLCRYLRKKSCIQ